MQLIKRADKNLYNTTKPLELITGETLVRYNNNVGKQEGNWVTVQRNYSSELIPFKEFLKASSALDTNFSLFQYECVKYNLDTKEIHFLDCPYFDRDAEPEIKSIVKYNPKADYINYKHISTIIKHKWLLVKDDYTGFDVKESYNHSKYEEDV